MDRTDNPPRTTTRRRSRRGRPASSAGDESPPQRRRTATRAPPRRTGGDLARSAGVDERRRPTARPAGRGAFSVDDAPAAGPRGSRRRLPGPAAVQRRRRTAADEPKGAPGHGCKKLRFALVVLGLALLAFVSWIFGIMMAVAQDLPQLENREQYKHAENSVVYDAYGSKLATLTNNQGRILVKSEPDLAGDEGGRRSRSRTSASTSTAASTSRASPAPSGRTSRPARRPRAPRRSPSSSSRTRSPRRTAAPCSRSCARRRSPTTSSASGPKDKILTEYLNEIYFGEGATGIEAAAKTYFGYNHPGCGTTDDPVDAAPTSCSRGRRRCSPG